MERINQIVAFWQRVTKRAAPKSIGISMNLPRGIVGMFHRGRILIHLAWSDDETVFHELVHLQQWQDGRLTYSFEPIISAADNPREVLKDAYHCYHVPGQVAFFEGRPVEELEYAERPVEIEARRLSAEYLNVFKCYEHQNHYAHN